MILKNTNKAKELLARLFEPAKKSAGNSSLTIYNKFVSEPFLLKIIVF